MCGRSFSSQKQLLAHHDVIHQSMDLQCDECGKSFASSQLLAQHHLRCSAAKRPRGGQVGRGHRTALQNNAAIESVTPTHNHDILMACKEVEPKIIDYLKEKLEETHIKWYVNMHCVFKKPKKDAVTGAPTDDFDTEDIYQASKTYSAIQPEDIGDVIPEVFQTISNKFQEFQREGSGWILDHVEKVEIHTAIYEPLMGTSYIELPPHLKKSRSIVNIQNKDNKCFL